MDRALKERIIGAIVLVAVVVLVVPVFLDGPPNDAETVTERVPLPGQADQKLQTVVLDRDRADPVPTPASDRGIDRDDEPDDEPETPAAGEPATLPVETLPEPEEAEVQADVTDPRAAEILQPPISQPI